MRDRTVICVNWLTRIGSAWFTHMCDIICECKWVSMSECVCVCVIIRSYVWHHMCDITCVTSYVWHHMCVRMERWWSWGSCVMWIMHVQGGEDQKDALSLQVIFHKRALQLLALLRKITCNWAHGKPRGFPEPPRATGIGPEPLRMVHPKSLILPFFSQNRKSQMSDLKSDVTTRRPIADRTSASIVLFRPPIRDWTFPNTRRPIWIRTLHLKSDFKSGSPPISKQTEKIKGKRAC